ncbi:MAG TPA: hypothetical protein VGK67_33630 [Myxococcales bacterium]|jgi:hypothetical protein
MKKTQFAVALVVSLMLVPSAFAQFGGIKSPVGGGGGGATGADIDNFLSAATAADLLVGKASTHMLKAVANKADVDKYEAAVKAANAIADPKEKQAKLDQAESDKNAALAAVDYKKTNDELAKSADKKKKTAIANAIWNLALGALKDTDLVATGTKLVSGTPSPSVATRIPAAKDALGKVTSQGEALGKIMGGAKSLMSTVGLDKLPAKASDEPKKSEGD